MDIFDPSAVWGIIFLTFGVLVFCPSKGLTDTCVPDAPDNCTFTSRAYFNKFCNWISDKWVFQRQRYSFANGTDCCYASLLSGRLTGRLTSRLACPTSPETHCLYFRYGFGSIGTDGSLRVFTKQRGAAAKLVYTVTPRMTRSTGTEWTQASVPIHETGSFHVIIEATRPELPLGSLIGIDNIRYVPTACRTTSLLSGGTTSTTLALPSVTSQPPTASPSQNSSNSVGTIVGSLAAVAVVVAVASLVCFLVKRRQLLCWKQSGNERSVGERKCFTLNPSYTPDLSASTNADGVEPSSAAGKVTNSSQNLYTSDNSGFKPSSADDSPQEFYSSICPHRREGHCYNTVDIPHEAQIKGVEFGELSAQESEKGIYEIHDESVLCDPSRQSSSHTDAGLGTGDYAEIEPGSMQDDAKAVIDDTSDRSVYSPQRLIANGPQGLCHILEEEDTAIAASEEELYSCLEEGGDAAGVPTAEVYHSRKEGSGSEPHAGGVYHCLDEETDNSRPQTTRLSPFLDPTQSEKPGSAEDSRRHEEDYKSLDFEGRTAAHQDGEREAVYSRLNEAPADTYSQLCRDRKVMVIDGNYSHVG